MAAGVIFGKASGDEESRSALKMLRARFLAAFTLSTQSEILRCAQDDSEGLGMTVQRMFAHRARSRTELDSHRTHKFESHMYFATATNQG
jgi:hypothetical protein